MNGKYAQKCLIKMIFYSQKTLIFIQYLNISTVGRPQTRKNMSQKLFKSAARKGGLSEIPVQDIVSNHTLLKKEQSKTYHESVLKFKLDVETDPLIKINFNDSVLQQQKQYQNGIRLLGNTVEEAFELINKGVLLPPIFENKSLIGVPFLALFLDYLQSPHGQRFFQNYKVNQHLHDIFQAYAKLLYSKESLEYIQGWISGDALTYWNPKQYEVDLNHPTLGFQCWHDFFLRRFKDEFRPIAEGQNVIANACQSFPLTVPEMPVKNLKLDDQFWLKDNRYSLKDMIGIEYLKQSKIDPSVLEEFVGGTVYQAFLDLWCYHRTHAPVDGKILAVYNIPGTYYLQNPEIKTNTKISKNYLYSQTFLTCAATRQVYLIQADNKKIGKIFLIMVGMVQVSGCYTWKEPGDIVKKGELIGEFRFGGSSHCLIFNKDCNLDFSISLKDAFYYDQKQEEQRSKKTLVRAPLAKLIQ